MTLLLQLMRSLAKDHSNYKILRYKIN